MLSIILPLTHVQIYNKKFKHMTKNKKNKLYMLTHDNKYIEIISSSFSNTPTSIVYKIRNLFLLIFLHNHNQNICKKFQDNFH